MILKNRKVTVTLPQTCFHRPHQNFRYECPVHGCFPCPPSQPLSCLLLVMLQQIQGALLPRCYDYLQNRDFVFLAFVVILLLLSLISLHQLSSNKIIHHYYNCYYNNTITAATGKQTAELLLTCTSHLKKSTYPHIQINIKHTTITHTFNVHIYGHYSKTMAKLLRNFFQINQDIPYTILFADNEVRNTKSENDLQGVLYKLNIICNERNFRMSSAETNQHLKDVNTSEQQQLQQTNHTNN